MRFLISQYRSGNRMAYRRFRGVPRVGADRTAWGRFIGVHLYLLGSFYSNFNSNWRYINYSSGGDFGFTIPKSTTLS